MEQKDTLKIDSNFKEEVLQNDLDLAQYLMISYMKITGLLSNHTQSDIEKLFKSIFDKNKENLYGRNLVDGKQFMEQCLTHFFLKLTRDQIEKVSRSYVEAWLNDKEPKELSL